MLTRSSNLFLTLGTIIASVFGNNKDPECPTAIGQLIPAIVTMEERLDAWEDALFPPLKLTGGEGPSFPPKSPVQSMFDRLRVVTRLRFLNVRLLLHRPLLAHQLRLHLGAGSDFSRRQSFSDGISSLGVRTCLESANQTLDIIHRDPLILGAWWCAAYYSKRTRSVFCMSADFQTSSECSTGHIQLLSPSLDHARRVSPKRRFITSRSRPTYGC